MTSTQKSAPAKTLAGHPARSDTVLDQTARLDSTPLPERITNDPRWRAVWRRLLMPVEAEAGGADDVPQ